MSEMWRNYDRLPSIRLFLSIHRRLNLADEKPVPTKRVRTPFDPETMGFGKHAYTFIDPKTVDIEKLTTPPNGIMRTREFTVAFNKMHPKTDVNIDVLSRNGCVFRTNAKDYEGEWVVVEMPALRSAVMYARCRRWLPTPGSKEEGTEQGEKIEISAVDLGIVPDRFSNLYKDEVESVHLHGGRATKETRERLTKLT